MKILKVAINLPADIIAGCMDFSEDNDIQGAIERTLTAFISLMKTRGKVPERSEEEIESMMSLMHAISEDDIFDGVEEFIPKKKTGTEDIGTQVERHIDSIATPNAKVEGKVSITEAADKPVPLKVNLFDQHRRTFVELQRESPKDRFIEQIRDNKLKGVKDDLLIASVEIAYTHLPKELWGSLRAEETIKQLYNSHDGTFYVAG